MSAWWRSLPSPQLSTSASPSEAGYMVRRKTLISLSSDGQTQRSEGTSRITQLCDSASVFSGPSGVWVVAKSSKALRKPIHGERVHRDTTAIGLEDLRLCLGTPTFKILARHQQPRRDYRAVWQARKPVGKIPEPLVW